MSLLTPRNWLYSLNASRSNSGVLRPRQAISLLTCLSIALVLGTAAFAKLTEIDHFEESIRLTQVLPGALVGPAARLIIAIELLVTVALLFRPIRRAGLLLVQVLSAVFFGYASWRFYQDIRVPCSCFGALFKIPPAGSMLISLLMCLGADAVLRQQDCSRPRGQPSCASG